MSQLSTEVVDTWKVGDDPEEKCAERPVNPNRIPVIRTRPSSAASHCYYCCISTGLVWPCTRA